MAECGLRHPGRVLARGPSAAGPMSPTGSSAAAALIRPIKKMCFFRCLHYHRYTDARCRHCRRQNVDVIDGILPLLMRRLSTLDYFDQDRDPQSAF